VKIKALLGIEEEGMLHIPTTRPQALLTKIQDAVREKEDPNGHTIDTWELDAEGKFVHTGSGGQWKRRGKLKGSAGTGGLNFRFEPGADKVDAKNVYGVYHGRFLELLINHFRSDSKVVKFTDTRKA
jgi:hypothetical protein